MHIMCGCRCDNKAQTLTKSSPGIHYTDVQIFNVQVQKSGKEEFYKRKSKLLNVVCRGLLFEGKIMRTTRLIKNFFPCGRGRDWRFKIGEFCWREKLRSAVRCSELFLGILSKWHTVGQV